MLNCGGFCKYILDEDFESLDFNLDYNVTILDADISNGILTLSAMSYSDEVEEFILEISDGENTIYYPIHYKSLVSTSGVSIDMKNKVRLYPIPANQNLTIEPQMPGHYFNELRSANGTVLSKFDFTGESYQLDLSPYQNGFYFITIRSKDFVTTRKIVIQ